ncbi:energy-coupling factor ABC transporter ATP-binding protein [Methanococcoides methylutens]|uniref:ATPase component NikO of energizing module of nickel ECF transporter n=1 Tax=Methanococcoides methylutens MM1 TaxID=1434104 RepID=A0A0E3SSQ9_METMT|nr:ABC transporter ATP-binding protein [Methanococcoides methylutens]AKB85653.1 ATPase component NikO of energizing module of nickel ECF transporter [Methanococcoides methylutens MM1]
MKKAISITDLNYSYPDGTKALDNVNIEIEQGEKIVIMGPNGAGKTTLFLHLNGVIRSDQDCVKIFGQNIGKMKTEDRIREVGVVFAEPDDQLFMSTVYDDVAFGPLNMGLDEEEVDRRVKKALATVGLEGFEEKVPHHMSFGQKKKAALAAVLSMEPRVLVLDEPTANLDPKSRADLIQVINDLNRNHGITTVIAMHDINALSDLADRVYVLNRSIVAEGTTREIFSDPILVKENNLDAPDIFKFFKIMNCFGGAHSQTPMSIDESVEELTRAIEALEGKMSLQVHENTHDMVDEVISSYKH